MNEPQIIFHLARVSKTFGHPAGLIRGRSTLVHAVDDVTLDIRRGEAFGLVGESGSGKSTLGRLLLGFETPSEGAVVFEGQPINELSRAELLAFRSRVQMVFQNTLASLNPRRTLRSSLVAGIKVHKTVRRAEIDDRLSELLSKVGLHHSMLARYPHQFSGGQRQRMVIARALSLQPDVLVADEAVSALDVSVQAQVLNLLKVLQETMHLTTVFIAHDLRVVNFFSDRIGVMYLGRLVEVGPRAAIISKSRHPYTRMLLSAAPGHRLVVDDESVVRGEIEYEHTDESTLRNGCVFSPRCWLREYLSKPERCTTEIPTLRATDIPEVKAACHFSDEVSRVQIRSATTGSPIE